MRMVVFSSTCPTLFIIAFKETFISTNKVMCVCLNVCVVTFLFIFKAFVVFLSTRRFDYYIKDSLFCCEYEPSVNIARIPSFQHFVFQYYLLKISTVLELMLILLFELIVFVVSLYPNPSSYLMR